MNQDVVYIYIGEGSGTPLQYSCLENPRDGGAWRAAVYGVAQSWTRLKRLSSSSIYTHTHTRTHTHTHIHTMESYSAIKKSEVMPFAATWMGLEGTVLSETSD